MDVPCGGRPETWDGRSACGITGDLLQNPVLSPTAKQLQSSLKEMESTTVELGLSSGVRVFILTKG